MTADYSAARDQAAFFDVSKTGTIEVSGPDAPAFLSNLSTNDVAKLPLGGGCETYFLDHRGKTLFHARAFHVLTADRTHAIRLDTTPGRNAALFAHLDRYLISEAAEIRDLTDAECRFHLAGPAAAAALESLTAAAVPPLAEFQHMERTVGRTPVSVRRFDPLGVPGFDLSATVAAAGTVRDALLAAGIAAGTPETFEILRVEAGTPVYGPDIDETRFVMEIARAARAVSYAKGCFIGQEPIVMARDRAGHVNRAFLAMKVLGGGPLPHGAKLLRDGQDVGVVTSSVDSPRLGGPLALGYLRRNHQDAGLQLLAETPDGPRPVELLGYPPFA